MNQALTALEDQRWSLRPGPEHGIWASFKSEQDAAKAVRMLYEMLAV